eukprot:3813513-Heterocapsa_arctica.AAC.1
MCIRDRPNSQVRGGWVVGGGSRISSLPDALPSGRPFGDMLVHAEMRTERRASDNLRLFDIPVLFPFCPQCRLPSVTWQSNARRRSSFPSLWR